LTCSTATSGQISSHRLSIVGNLLDSLGITKEFALATSPSNEAFDVDHWAALAEVF
jgi:hypothetical protein